MPKKYERTPEDEAKAAERQLKREARAQAHREKEAAARKKAEQEIQIARARPAHVSLRQLGSLGVVGLEGSNIDYFMQGLEASVEKSKGRVLTLQARGTIQGEGQDVDREADTLTEISRLRRDSELTGSRILAFVGFDYKDADSRGEQSITDRVLEIIRDKSSDLGVLVIGQGEFNDLPLSTHFDQEQHEVTRALAVHFGLTADNELSIAPELHAPQDRDTESMIHFAHLLPGSIGSRPV